MVYTCCVLGCRGNYPNTPKVELFSFPKEEKLKSKWISSIRRKDFILTGYSKGKMYFYHHTIKQSGNINHAIAGNFSGQNKSEIIISRGRILEIFAIDLPVGFMKSLLTTDLNVLIRSVVCVSHENKDKDYVAVGCDSGKLIILEFKLEERCFKPVLIHKFDKELKEISLRTSPGQYLAVDPHSQALVVGAIEKTLLFYNLTDEPNHFPLEANLERSIIYDIVGIYNESGNPLFAYLMAKYEKETKGEGHRSNIVSTSQDMDVVSQGIADSCSQKEENENLIKTFQQPLMSLNLCEYEINNNSLSVESVFLKCHGNMLIPVPPGSCHNSGVLICSCNIVIFVEIESKKTVQQLFPQRKCDAFNEKRGIYLISSALYKKDDLQVLLVQSEQGDLFSVTIERVDDLKLKIKMVYVDTIPVASAMCIFDRSFLFIGAEHGDSYLYKIKSLGDENEMLPFQNGKLMMFIARELRCLEILFKLESLSPLMKCISYPSCNDLLYLFCACGQGPSSSFKLLMHGVKASEKHLKEIPSYSTPNGIWSVKSNLSDESDAYIVVSDIPEITIVRSVGENMDLFFDSGVNLYVPTLACVQMESDSFIQVFPSGFHLVYGKDVMKYNVKCSCSDAALKEPKISCCAVYYKKIALSLDCKELVYIEIIKSADGKIELFSTLKKFKDDVKCMEFIPNEPNGKSTSLAVCFKEYLHIYSIKLEEMKFITEQKLPSIPVSLVVFSETEGNEFITYITISFDDGSIQRTELNKNRELKNIFFQKVDSKAVKLIKMKLNDDDAILAHGNHSWISFSINKKFRLVPFCDKLDYVSGFSSKFFPEANVIAISKKQLIILSVQNVSSVMKSSRLLEYTPRVSMPSPDSKFVIVSECDFRPPYHKIGDMTPQRAMNVEKRQNSELCSTGKDKKKLALSDCILHFIDYKSDIYMKGHLLPNHIAISMCFVQFHSKPNEQFILVSVKHNIFPIENKYKSYIYTYKVNGCGVDFEKYNKTEVDDVVMSLCPFQGCVLAGMKNKLSLYDIIEDSLVLRQVQEVPCHITDIYARGSIFVLICKHLNVMYGYLSVKDQTLVVFHTDRYLNNVVTICFWDDDIMVAAEIDNISLILLPAIPHLGIKSNFPASPMQSDDGKNKEEKDDVSLKFLRFVPESQIVVKYFVGEIVTSLQKTSLLEKGRDLILYATITGIIGIIVPFNEKEDIIFKPLQYLILGMSSLHMEDRTDWPKQNEDIYEKFQNEHAMCVIDGNLIELFNNFPEQIQCRIAAYLKKEPYEISGKLAEMNARIYFKD